MEDLLQPHECEGVAYLQGGLPKDPAQRVAQKALWVLKQPEGIRILKIKIGRVKWMNSFEDALERDISVVKAVRKAAGKNVTLFVDGNDGYNSRPLAAADFAEAVADEGVFAMEEMFSEKKVQDLRELKRRMRAKGIATKLADGENDRDGIPATICEEAFEGPKGREPLIDIEQADMNANGYLRMRRIAAHRARHRMVVAPHNFGSKMGFWSQVHLGLVTPNWEFCETDDSQFAALEPEGIHIRSGLATVQGPGLGVTLKEGALEAPSVVLENF
jgi:D-galactarolactone cycloisomerase